MLKRSLAAVLASSVLAAAQAPSTTYRTIPSLTPQIDAAPSLVPAIYDPTAPNAQAICPGYKASNVVNTTQGFTADLTIAGPACSAYGNDIADLTLAVEYQAKQRLSVKIYPRHLAPHNTSLYILPAFLTPEPSGDGSTTAATSDLSFTWSNEPSFQFKVSRVSNGEEIFSTYGYKIVFEDQFLELVTNMVKDYNVYGLAENIHDFRLGNNFTQTFYAADSGNPIDGNLYGTHPFYVETRYKDGASSLSHGVYARNAHGQEWLLRNRTITYRTIGGSFDLYFLSGPKPTDVIAQYQNGIVGLPALQMYWTFGFHQCRWGYENWTVLQEVVDGYANAGIQLEVIWNDIDYMNQYRDFTNGELNYPVGPGQEFLARLHAAGQHYVPIIDSNIYAENPSNASDAYEPFQRGAAMGAFIRNPGTGDFYYGDNWPGFSVWTDFLVPQGQEFWTYECSDWHSRIPYDGIWIDLSEASSFCVGSCGDGRLDQNPVHPPFKLPGEYLNVDYEFPEAFNITNATEASSLSAASASQSSANAAISTPAIVTTTQARTLPTPGVRNLDFPPYALNNLFDGHALVKNSIAPNATHNDALNTTEYEMHNLYGHQISNATYHALLQVFPGRRPFTVGRSTFAGSGNFTSHWGGDNNSKWGSMYLAIAQMFTFAMAGIPMFGVDTCGFSHNTDMELCARWMEMDAFMPFYRNHNVFASVAQEAYRWGSVAEATRRVMNIRYSLLTYMYTLFYYAHNEGETVMRALQWEFPDDASLAAVDNQFMLGPSLLITPVLQPLVTTVKGVFPGVAEGTIWYDYYTLQPLDVAAGENKTLDAPLEHINVHIRGGSILPMQVPGNTTETTKNNPYELTIALDKDGAATGSLYLDDGVSIAPNATKLIHLSYASDTLTTSLSGSYHSAAPLANITIAGVPSLPSGIDLSIAGQPCEAAAVTLVHGAGVLYLSGLEEFTPGGAWEGEMVLRFSF
ncbi:hypothetical protein LTR66_008016 [Elasticomyces elasticus]|nr:hypothetical protein LTR66_008016 [Elasticomyces elasticus]